MPSARPGVALSNRFSGSWCGDLTLCASNGSVYREALHCLSSQPLRFFTAEIAEAAKIHHETAKGRNDKTDFRSIAASACEGLPVHDRSSTLRFWHGVASNMLMSPFTPRKSTTKARGQRGQPPATVTPSEPCPSFFRHFVVSGFRVRLLAGSSCYEDITSSPFG